MKNSKREKSGARPPHSKLMKHLLSFLMLASCALSLAFQSDHAFAQREKGTGPSFKGPVGLQLYSLRDQFKSDVPGTLDKVRAMGIKYVELAGTYGLTPEKFKELLDARGLKATSGHFPYEQCRDNVEEIAGEATRKRAAEQTGC